MTKITKSLVSMVLVGTLALAGCKHKKNTLPKSYSERQSNFVTTAQGVTIKPRYGRDSTIMDGITMKRVVYGNGLDVPNIDDSVIYKKGSQEYETLRPLLTIKKQK